jgi:threonine dehydrogenase-like Zn-dependent dehydrogenase
MRSLNPGGVCTAVGYYLKPGTKVPMMHMYANDATLKVGVSSVRPQLPDLLDFVARTGFPAETVTTVTADWDDAPTRTLPAPQNWCCAEILCLSYELQMFVFDMSTWR